VYIEALTEAVLQGNVDEARAHTDQALAQGTPAEVILSDTLVPAMDQVGQLFEQGQFFLPEMLAAGVAMKACMQSLGPHLSARGSRRSKGRVVLGTVKGDVHDIGKNLVGLMLEGAGFEVTDLGIDVARSRFVELADEADIIGLSGLVSTTIPEMANVILALVEAGVRDRVQVLVGGAPITQQFADQIGADGYAKDAAAAVRVAEQVVRSASRRV